MKFRAARHTNDLQAIYEFYHDILGLDFLGQFKEHESYNGMFFGKEGENWHLEFTTSSDAPDHHPDEDDIWVFYFTDEQLLQEKIKAIVNQGIPKVTSKNPYWDRHGATFLDPDGFRIVLALSKS